MSNLKPVAILIDDRRHTTGVESADSLSSRGLTIDGAIEYWGDQVTPLYAIPEGYHITPIEPVSPDQAIRDKLDRHNDSLRAETVSCIDHPLACVKAKAKTDYYQLGYRGTRLPIWCSDDEEAEYNQGAKDRQREKGDE